MHQHLHSEATSVLAQGIDHSLRICGTLESDHRSSPDLHGDILAQALGQLKRGHTRTWLLRCAHGRFSLLGQAVWLGGLRAVAMKMGRVVVVGGHAGVHPQGLVFGLLLLHLKRPLFVPRVAMNFSSLALHLKVMQRSLEVGTCRQQ